MFKLTQINGIQQISNGAFLPARFENGKLVELDEHSPFIKELREWIAMGNILNPADPIPEPIPVKDILDKILDLSPARKALLKTELGRL